MTKSGKHKKEFRKEKNKIKLRLSAQSKAIARAGKGKKGKKGGLLPKGLNVTDTSFKSRKIVLPDNLRPDDSENIPLTRKKQTFKELLSHMSHYNSTLQLDGISGMKELLVGHPDILEGNLSQVIGKLAELSVSRESTVRKSSLQLLELIVGSATEERVTPFFPLLVAQLLCAMNHIQVDIQQDSHAFLDLLLNGVPSLVAPVTMRILPNFLEQISSRGEGGNSGKRVLAINPTRRLTSLKWRQEVLTRISKLLELIPSARTDEPTADLSTSRTNQLTDNHFCCPLYICQPSNLKLNIPTPGQVSCKAIGEENDAVREFTGHLFPLLIETWIEAMAGEQLSKSNQSGSLIGADSAALLSCICNVIVVLWNILKDAENAADLLPWFESQFGDQVTRNLIQRMPFSCRPDHRKSAPKIDTGCRHQNLMLSFLWAQMGSVKSSAKYATTVFQYIGHVFNSTDQQPLTHAETEQIKETLKMASTRKAYQSHVDRVIETAVRFIRRSRADRKDRLAVSRALIDVALGTEDMDRIPSLKKWIETCPQLLQDEGNLSLLPSINRAMSRNWNVLTAGRQQVVGLLQKSADCQPTEWRWLMDFVFWTCQHWEDRGKVVPILQPKSEDPYTRGILHALRSP